MSIDITSELLGSSSPSLKFKAEGDAHRITIREIAKQQETDFDTGAPVTWPSGDPKFQYVVTGTADGEEARLFIKGYMIDALKDALRKAGVQPGTDLTGGTLTIKWNATDEPRRAGMQGARRYIGKFEPAAKAVVDDDLI